jgi:acetyl-CoA carboxylase alpha subunit
MTAEDLLKLKAADRIFPEPENGDFTPLYDELQENIFSFFQKETTFSGEALAKSRYERFRQRF